MVTVERSVRYLQGRWLVGPPKTEAGRRTVALPQFVAVQVAAHLDAHVGAHPDALLFAMRSGRFLSGANFGVTSRRAAERAGLPPRPGLKIRHCPASGTISRTTTRR